MEVFYNSNEELANKLKLMRNHGLLNRNTCVEFAYNSRLDTIQAVVAKYLIEKKLSNITDSRIKNAMRLDSMLEKVPQISLLKRDKDLKEVFHLYIFKAEKRDKLYDHLRKRYRCQGSLSVPMHLQPAANYLGYVEGDFPIAEAYAKNTISLPVHEFITLEQIEKMAGIIKEFYL